MARYVPRMPREDQPIPAELHLRCSACGYELTGLIERRCPECGAFFDPRETWLENEQATWEYHFENVRSKWDYVAIGYVALAGVVYAVLVWRSAMALVALPLVLLGEGRVFYAGGGGLTIRMLYATACVAWGIVAVILW